MRRVKSRFPRGQWWIEVPVLLVVYAIYGWVRGRIEGSPGDALDHAHQVIHAERVLHMFHEARVQHWFLPHHLVVQFWDVFYGTVHFAGPILGLAILWRRAPERYRFWRNAFGWMLALALIGFWLYPLTPPRLLPHQFGFVDTSVTIGGMGPFTEDPKHAANLYAAMPSLHIGWSTWVAVALFPVLRHWWSRAIVVLYPFVMLTAVVVTANHYILDGAGGVGALALGVVLAWGVDRVRGRRPVVLTAAKSSG